MNEEILLKEIEELRKVLKKKESQLDALRNARQIIQQYGLSNEEVTRYSRQILLPEIGVKGQTKLKNSSVLIVGAGGLGCPSSLYLAGGGIGHIGIIDYDEIEINNLHRQLLFSHKDLGIPKVHAAKEFLTRLNNNVTVTPYKMQLDSTNALEIIKEYDVVVDASDNVATRYLLNDACVIANKPLISGSVLRFEGQLTVYNYKTGPCFRCIFPIPPPPETVTNCGEGGILGAVAGTVGVLQALEVIKVILNLPGVLSGKLFMFDGLDARFKNVKLRPKNANCSVCGSNPQIRELIDYEQFCGAKANDKNPDLKLLRTNERISVEDYHELIRAQLMVHVLIDVRSCEEFQICHLEGSINIPYTEIEKSSNLAKVKEEIERIGKRDVYVMCRRGNDSQKAVRILQKALTNENLKIRDIIGGIHAWARKIDEKFPIY